MELTCHGAKQCQILSLHPRWPTTVHVKICLKKIWILGHLKQPLPVDKHLNSSVAIPGLCCFPSLTLAWMSLGDISRVSEATGLLCSCLGMVNENWGTLRPYAFAFRSSWVRMPSTTSVTYGFPTVFFPPQWRGFWAYKGSFEGCPYGRNYFISFYSWTQMQVNKSGMKIGRQDYYKRKKEHWTKGPSTY